MFGYVAPHKCELKVSELAQYQASYCGLCHTLHTGYGHIPRLALNYDCTFLALLLEGVDGTAEVNSLKRCYVKPFRKKSPVASPSPALDYAAACNVLLARYKLIDDWYDERSIKGLVGGRFLLSASKKAAGKYPDVALHVLGGINALSAMEKAGEPEIDRAADAFASMLRSIMSGYNNVDKRDSEVLGWLGYYLGRWIYLIDAWDDREKSGYNPFTAAGADKERASFLLYAALYEMENAYDLLNIKSHKGLLDNIIYEGCRIKTRQLLGGEPDESV